MANKLTLLRVIDAKSKSTSSGSVVFAMWPARAIASKSQSTDVQALIGAWNW